MKFIYIPFDPILYLAEGKRHVAWEDAKPNEKFEATGFFQCPTWDEYPVLNEQALDSLYAQKEALVQKIETLKTHTSPLAQNLLANKQEKLNNLVQEIAQKEKELAEVKEKVEENNQSILQRENNPSSFIEEQSRIIISFFLEYIGDHLEELGEEVKKTFCIREVTRFKYDGYSGYYIPTGKVGIYDKTSESFIVYSTSLYTIYRGSYDKLCCYKTEWYKFYLDYFVQFLLETLEKEYSYGDCFKLTLGDSDFTLELI